MCSAKITVFSFMCVLLFIFGCQSPEQDREEKQQSGNNQSVNRYITAEEYLQRHPQEMKISARFSQIVQQPADPMSSNIQKKPVSIAFVYPGQQASDYWCRSLQSFKARMDELGISYEVREFFSQGGGVEIRKQEQQLKEALDHDPDYLVFTLDVSQHQRRIEQILAQKRPRLILQNITTPLVVWEGKQPFYVGFDHAIGSRLLADYFLKHSADAGSYGLLYYSQGYVSTMRGDTFLRYMKEGQGLDLSGSFYTAGKRDNARKAVLKLAEDKELRFIYACSTDVALGAIDGLKETGRLEGVAVNGWGGGSAELAALASGELDVTVMRMNDDNGVAMAEAIRLELLGRDDEVPTVFSGEFVLVTRETSREKVAVLKKQAFRYSGVTSNKQ